jgi:hypothetical protein
MTTSPDLLQHIEEYLEALAAADRAWALKTAEAYAERDGKSVDYYLELHGRSRHTYWLEPANGNVKYLKIAQSSGGQTFVHAFIDKETGAVYKPAGWRSPAKGKDGKPSERYNLLDAESRQRCFERCEFSGGYLYADRAYAGR